MPKERIPAPEFTPDELQYIEKMTQDVVKRGELPAIARRIAEVSMRSLRKERKESSGAFRTEELERRNPDLR